MERKRIAILNVDGEIKVVKRHKNFFGRVISGVKLTSESPEHAAASIRKVAAFKRLQLQNLQAN